MNKLKRMKNELKAIRKEDSPYISLEEIQDICKYLSKEAAEDVMKNGYKDGNLIYKSLRTETLIELTGPDAKVLITGTEKGTRVFIDDVSD